MSGNRDDDQDSFQEIYKHYLRLPGGTHDWQWNGAVKVPTRRSVEAKLERCAIRVFNDGRDSMGSPTMTLDAARGLVEGLHA